MSLIVNPSTIIKGDLSALAKSEASKEDSDEEEQENGQQRKQWGDGAPGPAMFNFADMPLEMTSSQMEGMGYNLEEEWYFLNRFVLFYLITAHITL